GKGSGSLHALNPSQTESGRDSTGKTRRPGFIGTAHELVGHGIDNARGQHVPKIKDNIRDKIPASERAAIKRENEIRAEHSGIPPRIDYLLKKP
ncbi:MAG TPA: hypothetical protein VGK77_19445, partial [Candidatus Binatia bacterium]